jgi:hypothetical protein
MTDVNPRTRRRREFEEPTSLRRLDVNPRTPRQPEDRHVNTRTPRQWREPSRGGERGAMRGTRGRHKMRRGRAERGRMAGECDEKSVEREMEVERCDACGMCDSVRRQEGEREIA